MALKVLHEYVQRRCLKYNLPENEWSTIPMKFAGMSLMNVSHSTDLIALLIYPLLRTEYNEIYSFSFKRAPLFLQMTIANYLGIN